MSLKDNPSIVELVGIEVLDEAEDDASGLLKSFNESQFNLSKENIESIKQTIIASSHKSAQKTRNT
jgi:hypothetical protein